MGSGKTIALCADAILLALQQPGSLILVTRQTITSLKDTTEAELVNLLQALPPDLEEDTEALTLWDLCKVKKSGGHISHIEFPNGSMILFRGLDDWRKLMGFNLCAIYIDEATEVSYETYLALRTRLRQKQPLPRARRMGAKLITRRLIGICCNPNGHDWVWEHFVNEPDNKPALRQRRRFFRSTSFDNPTLYNEDGSPGDFLMDLLTMPEMFMRRMVFAEFDAFAGQIFNFQPEIHITEHFTPPAEWPRAMGLDWGLRNPTAIVWWAQNPETKNWVQYREWQSYDAADPMARDVAVTPTVHQVAAIIKQLEQGETIRWRAIDPACANRQADSGKSVMYWMAHYGLHFRKGMKDYNSRIQALQQLLERNQLQLTTSCPMTTIAIQQYRWEDLNPANKNDGPERPQKKNDHLVDASQYLATLFTATIDAPTTAEPETFDKQIWQGVKKQIARRQYKRRGTVL